jgi:hypothetical protein
VSTDDVITIRYCAKVYSIAAAAFVVLLLISGAARWETFSTDVRAWLLAGVIFFVLWRALDRRPVLILNRTGFRDRRLGTALFPWSAVSRVEPVSNDWLKFQGVTLHFDRNVTVARFYGSYETSAVFIKMGPGIDIEPGRFVEYLRRFAPDVAIDTRNLKIQ